MTTTLTDEQFDISDRLTEVLAENPNASMSPSVLARKVKVETRQAYPILDWLVANHLVLVEGNGAWKRYSHRPLHTPVH